MSIWKQHVRRGSAVIASFAIAMALLFVGPASTTLALALSNNLVTTISLNTNAATGSNTFTAVAPITVTCGVVDITAGAADGVAGVTLTLSAGWTFLGGVAPTIGYAWGGGPTGDATGTIASATSITVAILASCDPGDVITLTGVQVKPTTSISGNATITADINTADVTAASITATAAAPTVTAIAPASGPLAGGTAVTITGTGFVAGATVTIGGTAATSVVFGGATSITAVTPAGAAGTASVLVTNPDTQVNAANALYTYAAAPTVTAIATATGVPAGGIAVTVTGTGFVAGATVTIGGAAATGVAFVSATSITAVTPAGALGTASVLVTNPDTQVNAANTLYMYAAPVVDEIEYAAAPTVTAITSANGVLVGGRTVTITGTGFVAGATVTIGGTAATSVVVSATSIIAVTPAGAAGMASVVVTNPDTQANAANILFTYASAPVIVPVVPVVSTRPVVALAVTIPVVPAPPVTVTVAPPVVVVPPAIVPLVPVPVTVPTPAKTGNADLDGGNSSTWTLIGLMAAVLIATAGARLLGRRR